LLAVAIVGVVISIYYYFGWIRAAFFPTWHAPVAEGEPVPDHAFAPVGAAAGFTLGVLALSSVVLGFYQGAFGQWLLSR
jgi:NADH-quinone oxidoreductase subunit N